MLSPPQCGAQKLLVVMPAPHLSLEEGCGILRRPISLQGHAIRKWDSRVGHVCNPDHHLLTETWWRPPCSFFPWKLMPKSPKALSLSDSTWHVPRRPRASKPVSPCPCRPGWPVLSELMSCQWGRGLSLAHCFRCLVIVLTKGDILAVRSGKRLLPRPPGPQLDLRRTVYKLRTSCSV